MTDLQDKFTHLEGLITENQTELASLLLPIASIDEGVQSANTTLTDSNADFSAFASALLTNLSVMSANMTNGLNAIKTAVLNSACPCSYDGPLLPVPVSPVVTTTPQEALCRRIQYFIDLYRLGVLANASAYVYSAGSMSAVTAAQLQANALTERDITTGEIAQGMPTSTSSGVASAWNNWIAAVGAPAAQSDVYDLAVDLANWQGLQSALYNNISSSLAFPDVADAFATMDTPDAVKSIVANGFYSSWLNDIYSEVPIVDDSEYDGTVCSNPGVGYCATLIEDYSFDMAKSVDNGNQYVWFTVPSWATYIEWDVSFSENFWVHFSPEQIPDGTPFSGIDYESAVFTGRSGATWLEDTHSIRYFGIGGFYFGEVNGHVVNITIHSLKACIGV